MPSNPIDEFTAGLQPADILTLLAGLRSSVPVYAALGATGLNEGEDEELARRRPPAQAPAPRPRTYEDDQRDFEAQFPDPKIRSAVLAELIAQRTQPYHPATATRRKDFEAAPEGARQSMQPMARKKFAGGGTVQRFNKGGKAAKTLDQMQAELFKKGTKAADKPNLSRRSFFGLGPQSSFPLANVDTKALEKMQSELKGAPAITEKTVTVDPGKGSMSETIKSVAATPMSRRSVLQSAAGQALQGVLPKGALSIAGDVAKEAVQSVAPAASSLTNPYAVIMSMLKQGKSEEDIMKIFAKDKPEYNEYAVENMIGNVQNPSGYLYGDLPTLKTPSGALREIVEFKADGWDDHLSPLKLKPELRQLRSADPEAYRSIVNAAKDISMLSAEEAANIGLKPKWIEKFMRGEIDYSELPQNYQRKIDNINAGFGSEN